MIKARRKRVKLRIVKPCCYLFGWQGLFLLLRGANMAKSRRRARGEGSVFQRKDGRWVVQIELGDGKRKQFYVKSEREGVKKLRQAQLELEQGTLATGPQRKLKDYLEDWIENVHKDKLRISTYVKY